MTKQELKNNGLIKTETSFGYGEKKLYKYETADGRVFKAMWSYSNKHYIVTLTENGETRRYDAQHTSIKDIEVDLSRIANGKTGLYKRYWYFVD